MKNLKPKIHTIMELRDKAIIYEWGHVNKHVYFMVIRMPTSSENSQGEYSASDPRVKKNMAAIY